MNTPVYKARLQNHILEPVAEKMLRAPAYLKGDYLTIYDELH